MKNKYIYILSILFFYLLSLPVSAQKKTDRLKKKIDQLAENINKEVIDLRHYFHQHPELSNREYGTAKKIAEELKKLGIEVQTGVAHTGVVGILRGTSATPIIALRADIDGLPVTEKVDIPYASKVKATYNNQEVGVMHACGHDTHIAILLGVAKTLASIKNEIAGTVKFIFQPAEEGAPKGEEGGAQLMVKEGVLKNPDVDVIFGLHINSKMETGKIGYKPGGTMAASDELTIQVYGEQTHGGYPWGGVDPIVTAAQIIMGLQTIVSRQLELVNEAAVISIGSIHGGVRNNIIPSQVTMVGTIRSLDKKMQNRIHEKVKRTAEKMAQSMGAKAEVTIKKGYRITYNDPKLTEMMLPTLKEVAKEENVFLRKAVTGAEDFSFYAEQVPGLFFFLGGMPKGKDPKEAAPHHTPTFLIDDSSLNLGVRSMSRLVVDYIEKTTR